VYNNAVNSADFVHTLDQNEPPPGLGAPLQALWWDARGEWQRAHTIVDELETASGMSVHAYLHRKENDIGNAAYWYGRAGRAFPEDALNEEWARLLEELLPASQNDPEATH
jgi:hypothetical protein